ncbi:putative fungal specific transcription protein [Neofusicoccum parvum UCRNP2]|uniref:Putative fungal specific transcription protein n=1 Tax=Botryosphaeria parva (strain UCR-NP2) TaxID=1287680 RepID=R1FVY5_BOTPV|nr:putative fungal specific transcription protein [Neofusicoccum parvum UCRNP2]
MSVYAELSMVNNDLFSAQALIGMARFFSGDTNSRPSNAFASAAIRILHSLGIHKSKSHPNTNSIEMEQRRRIFWIAYAFDKEFSLRSGRPFMQIDDDIDVDLPSDHPGHNMSGTASRYGLAPSNAEFIVFRAKCALAVLKSKIYRLLYSAHSWDKSEDEILQTVTELEKELDEWKTSLPYALHPDHNVGHLPDQVLLYTLAMRFAYYHCATSIRLLKFIPPGWESFNCFILYYAASSFMILFSYLLQNPQGSTFTADLERMWSVQKFGLGMCSEDKEVRESSDFQKVITIMHGCEQIVLQQQEKCSGDKRPPQSNEEAFNEAMLNFGHDFEYFDFPEFGF